MFTLTFALAILGSEDPTSLLAEVAQRYKRLQPLHLRYTERAETVIPADAEPALRAQLKAHIAEAGNSQVKECELWFAWPRIRLDEIRKQKDFVIRRRHVWDSGRLYHYDLDPNYIIESSSSNLGSCGGTALEPLGLIAPHTVSTTLAALISEQKGVPLRIEFLPSGARKLVLGPGLPRTFWGGRIGDRGTFYATFESGGSPILKEFGYVRPRKVSRKGEPDRETAVVTKYSCSDYRPVPNGRGGDESFPFKLVLESGGFARTEWGIHEAQIGRPIAASTLAVNARPGALVQKDGKVPDLKSAKAGDATAAVNRYVEKLELPAAALSSASPPWGWGAWLAAAFSVLGVFLAFVGIWRLYYAK